MEIFNATVREEILYKTRDPDMLLFDWLVDSLGLRRHLDTPPLLLSEGEKKRVALAIVLMRDPSHGALLDEPSVGQDSAHERTLLRVARSLAKAGRLVIMATHDLHLAAASDRLLLLGREGWVADGPALKSCPTPARGAVWGCSFRRGFLKSSCRIGAGGRETWWIW